MNEGLIPRRYAKALFKVAVERNCENRIYQFMLQLDASFKASEQFRNVIKNPFVDNKDKIEAITAAANADKSDKTFVDFLHLLIQNRRIDLCGLIAEAFVTLFRQQRNIHRVELISATKLSPEIENRVKKIVEQHLHGATMEFESQIDPEIIGGFIIIVDNERLDASLRHQLKEIRLNLLNN